MLRLLLCRGILILRMTDGNTPFWVTCRRVSTRAPDSCPCELGTQIDTEGAACYG